MYAIFVNQVHDVSFSFLMIYLELIFFAMSMFEILLPDHVLFRFTVLEPLFITNMTSVIVV